MTHAFFTLTGRFASVMDVKLIFQVLVFILAISRYCVVSFTGMGLCNSLHRQFALKNSLKLGNF